MFFCCWVSRHAEVHPHQHGSPVLHASGGALLQDKVLSGVDLVQNGRRDRAGQPACGQVGLLLLLLSCLHSTLRLLASPSLR